MKKLIAQTTTLLLVLTIAAVLPAMAQSSSHTHGSAEDAHKVMEKGKSVEGDAMDHSKMGHDMTKGAEDAAKGAMDHGKMDHDMTKMGKGGKNWIREAHVQGHHFAYELIDMREKMKNMPGMKNTHHLMVFIKDAQGNNLGKAKVGYLIKGPGDVSQKAMCMGMGGGFGSDVNLGKPGTYSIKAKVKAGDTKLMDSFEYEVK